MRSRICLMVLVAGLAAGCSSGSSTTTPSGGTASPTSSAHSSAASPAPSQQSASLNSAGQVSLSHTQLQAGLVQFSYSLSPKQVGGSGNTDLQLFQLQPGGTLVTFRKEVAGAMGNSPTAAAASIRWIIPHIGARGGNVGTPGATQFEAVLQPGTYYVGDLDSWAHSGGQKGLASFTVTGPPSHVQLPPTDQTITMMEVAKDQQRFVLSSSTIHPGVIRVTNGSDELHMVLVAPVKAGTTVQQVIKSLSSQNGAVFTGPPVAGLDVLSPHASVNWKFQAPAGHYVAVCFIPDSTTGMPHFTMGMVTFFDVTS